MDLFDFAEENSSNEISEIQFDEKDQKCASAVMAIPSFLLRSKGEAGPRRNHGPNKIKWVMPKLPHSQRPPKSKTFRGAEKVTIHLADECKSIGAGVRTVWAKRGRKWVYLCDPLGNRGRLTLAVFDRICLLDQS